MNPSLELYVCVFRNSEEISEFVSILQFLLRYYGISDAKMEWVC